MNFKCVHLCVCVCACACVYVCVCVHLCICMCMHTYMPASKFFGVVKTLSFFLSEFNSLKNYLQLVLHFGCCI